LIRCAWFISRKVGSTSDADGMSMTTSVVISSSRRPRNSILASA
jgi:hypothetical protein